MTFYEALTPYYDDIFPANEKQLKFISSYYPHGSSLLDVGAGTGNIAYALAEAGYIVTAAEPEEVMCAKIRKKAEQTPQQLKAIAYPMQELGRLKESYDGIYCVGNTLVHLQNMDEIRDFLRDAYTKLRVEGTLLIQIVNYEKVLHSEKFAFPAVRKEHFAFERSYEVVHDKVLFTTTITANGETKSSTIPLYPATYQQLLPLLEQCGYRAIEAYANFDKAPYTPDAPALVFAARKWL